MRLILGLALAAILSAPRTPGDILHLSDGTRYYGEVISQTPHSITFRIASADQRAALVRTFLFSEVARVEKTAQNAPPAASRPQAPPEVDPAAQREAQVRSALDDAAHGRTLQALRALQLVANAAKPAELERFSALTRAARGLDLPDLLADLRVRAALERWPAKPFDLRGVTRMERPPLGRLLETRIDELLARRYGERRIIDWPDCGEPYTELQPDTRRMVEDASLAVAMISARLRFDPRLLKDRATRQKLVTLRDGLSRFIGNVLTLPGYTLLLSDPSENAPPAPESAEPAPAEPEPGSETEGDAP